MIIAEITVDGNVVRQIPHYPNYWITCHGYVWSEGRKITKKNGQKCFLKPRWLQSEVGEKGYAAVHLRKDDKTFIKNIHVLVALCWIGPLPFEGALVRHLDDVRSNNHYKNLSYGGKSSNYLDGVKNGLIGIGENRWNAKLTDEKVRKIKADLLAERDILEIADEYGVNHSTIRDIANGKTWKHIT